MLEEAINSFEELKKYIFIINRGAKKSIVIKFNNSNFYHLVGLHKTNINMFIPTNIKTMDKKYKYIKKNLKQFEGILQDQIKEKDFLQNRIKTFRNVLDLLSENKNTMLFNLKEKTPGSMYDGDFGLLKIYEELSCLLGLKVNEEEINTIYCAPQSWMVNNRPNRLVEGKRPIYMETILKIPIAAYDENNICI